MAPTPKRVDSVSCTNQGSSPCTVSVVFDNHKDKIELQEDHQIEAGSTYLFTEKELDMGSWKAVAPVKKITVSHANGLTHSLQPEVSGVVKKLEITVQGDGKLKQGAEVNP